jgi:hydrogenase maturation protease
MIDAPPIMIIGIGNLDRGDDAAGRLVARALRYKLPSHIVGVCEMSGEALGLVEKMKRAPTVFVIDACLSGKKAGEIRRIDLRHEALPSQQRDVSSHGFGLLAALDLASILGQLPEICIIYAIEGENYSLGAAVSSSVQQAIEKVVSRIEEDIINCIPMKETGHA